MTEINIPILKEGGKLRLDVSKELYAPEAIAASLYKFSDKFFVFQTPSENKENTISLFFESKDGNTIPEETVKTFCNDLADQQIRYLTEKEFGHIRNLIVEEAFKPVNR